MSRIAAVRTERGKLHVARREAGGWVPGCYQQLKGREIVVYRGRQALLAWRYEDRCCLDCVGLLSRGAAGFRRAAGW